MKRRWKHRNHKLGIRAHDCDDCVFMFTDHDSGNDLYLHFYDDDHICLVSRYGDQGWEYRSRTIIRVNGEWK